MYIVKKIFVIILFCEASCAWEQLIDRNMSRNLNEATFRIYDVLIKIFEFHKENYDTVLISSEIYGINLKWLEELQGDVSIFSYGKTTNYESLKHFKKFDAFVLIVEKIMNVDEILFDIIEDTEWWNVMIPVYILYTEPCNVTIAKDVFEVIKFYESLTSYLLCSDANQDIKIYTYNLISDYAPGEWNLVEEAVHDWNLTLFERTYLGGDINPDFDFDRTKNLSDYEIIVAGDPYESYSTLVNNFHDRQILNDHPEYFTPLNRLIVDTLATALNVKVAIYFHAAQSSNEKYLNSWEIFKYDTWLNSSCDVFLTVNSIYADEYHFPLVGSYPASWAEYAIVTYHKGYQTPLEKIRDFYGVWISLFTLFVLIVTFFVIWLTKNKSIAFTIFEIIRLLISQGLYVPMNTLSLRIFFGVVLMYFLIVQATFNGHMAEFLTKPQLRKHPETLEDLNNLGFTEVYYKEDVKSLLAKTPEEKASLNTLTKTCLQYLIHNNTSAACIENNIELQYQTHNQKNLYLSKKTFGSFYCQYPIRRESPLYHHLYRFFILFEELGFRQYINLNIVNYFYYSDRVDEAKLNQVFRPINLDNLIFIFIILGIGLSAATLSFLIEIFLHLRKCERSYKG